MSRVVQRDNGAKALIKLTKGKNQPRLKVGAIGDAAAAKHKDGNGATVGEIITAHEFGLGNVPERSIIRAYVDENRPRIAEMVKRVGVQTALGKISAVAGLKLIGFKIVGEIQARMAEGIPPPLSPEYLKKKLAKYPGAATPLIASGQSRSAITHVVTDAQGTVIT